MNVLFSLEAQHQLVMGGFIRIRIHADENTPRVDPRKLKLNKLSGFQDASGEHICHGAAHK
jgi:hypothetical protein